MWTRTLFLATAAALAASAPADAARKPIKGKLTRSGYTVVALSVTGKARSAETTDSGKFSVRPPAAKATLHLRNSAGKYAGPIVMRRDDDEAIVGVKAGARLGAIKVSSRKRFAKVKKRLGDKWLVASRRAKAKKGVPIGARRFGRVRSRRAEPVRGDLDRDGVPDQLDIDDDGDLVFDQLDRSQRGRAAQAQSSLGLHTGMSLGLEETVNVNAPGFSEPSVNETLRDRGNLFMNILAPSSELDCEGDPNPSPPPAWLGGLRYCVPGGSGTYLLSDNNFPECCDDDGDGFGTPVADTPGGTGFHLTHGADTTEITAGQWMTACIPDCREPASSEVSELLDFVFVTVPALVSYADGAGTAGSVGYPVASGGPGTQGNGFLVAPCPAATTTCAAGEIELTLTMWPPQRRAMPGDPAGATWMDMGNLFYSVAVIPLFSEDPTGSPKGCPRDAFSVEGERMEIAPGAGVDDTQGDQPASVGNTVSFSVNVSECLAAHGLSWAPGQERQLFLVANTHLDGTAIQRVYFRRP